MQYHCWCSLSPWTAWQMNISWRNLCTWQTNWCISNCLWCYFWSATHR
jgi:hypothetical protein